MYDPKTGTFFYGDDEAGKIGMLQKESAYYLKFNSEKALYAIDQLKQEYKGVSLADKCFHYHVYVDLLFEAVGLIYNRFVCTRRNAPANVLKLQQMNRQQYEFDESRFPLLHDKSFRNFIEHINERDERLVDSNNYFGTFNMIFSGMDMNTRKDLLKTDKPQNNLLNLEDMSYTILESNGGAVTQKTISILQLETEIKDINEISNKLWSFLTDAVL